MNRVTGPARAAGDGEASKRRAFRGLVLVFILTFLNLVGIFFTIAALGGLGEWSHWQFLGLFGVLEASAGLSNILSPNIWHLPVAQANNNGAGRVRLAASTVFLPHWGGGARAAAGGVLIGLALWGEGVHPESLLLLALVFALVTLFLAAAALLARLGTAYPDTDVLSITIGWRRREKSLPPLSLTASLQQFLLGILALPAFKALEPGALFAPHMRPSDGLVAIALTAAALVSFLALFAWRGRLQLQASEPQQQEVEQNA